MKDNICIVFIFAFAFAQQAIGQFHLDFSTGINNSTSEFTNLAVYPTKFRQDFFISVAPGYQLNERFNVLINTQYSRKGYQSEYINSFLPYAYRYAYIDIIPELEYSVLDFITLGVGINYAIKTDEEGKSDDSGWVSTKDLETIKPFDFGLTAKVKISYRNLFGFVRYNHGISNISNLSFTDENGAEIGDINQLNRNLQIGIGYRLKIGKG